MISTRIIKKTGDISKQTRYFICSGKKDAEEFFKAIRWLWEIES
jgi:predicted transposase YbfD/YdcC